jgi:hypothetical protein
MQIREENERITVIGRKYFFVRTWTVMAKYNVNLEEYINEYWFNI